ncbi:MAG: GNAT family N-acetyltransferase [Parcubacteria group bacterium]|nr:GNAT family N-acetyltransferase [Parcubacteria group bacterium]
MKCPKCGSWCAEDPTDGYWCQNPRCQHVWHPGPKELMQFTIRKADKRHLSDINRLIVEAKIGSPMEKLDGQYWIAKVGGRVVGSMGATTIDNSTAVLTTLAVEKPYRKRGIGMSLFNHAVNHVRTQGATTIGFITMYYHFRRFKRRGFKTMPRKFLSEPLKSHWMFTAKRYMKCAAMVQTFPSRAT